MLSATKEIKILIPEDLFSIQEVYHLLLGKAMGKAEYYRSRKKEFEEKYNTDFETFRKKVETSKKERFDYWDDLLLWEGFEKAHQEWKQKYEALKECSRL
jgi:hypothetical protein